MLGQSFRNDAAHGPDRLNIVGEVNALAKMLMLRDLEPPIAVGILGGWGSGKSFVMHLMQDEINRIRGLKLEPAKAWPAPKESDSSESSSEQVANEEKASPFVGHIYQINFNAWTYAKSNLWASLMQTIFVELSRQLTLEKRLEQAGVDPPAGGRVWRALNQMSDDERNLLLEHNLGKEYKTWQQSAEGDVDDHLWDVLRQLQGEVQSTLKEKQNALDNRQAKLTALQTELDALTAPLSPDSEAVKAKVDEAGELIAAQFKEVLGSAFEAFRTQVKRSADLGETEINLEHIKPSFSKLFELARQDRKEFMFFVIIGLFAVVAFVLAGLIQQIQLPATVVAVLSALASILPPLQKGLNRWGETVMDSYNKFQTLRAEKERQLIQEQEATRQANRAKKEKELAKRQTEITALNTEIERLRAKIGLAARYESALHFVQTRLQDGFYQEQLGLMHQVQLDLVELSDSLALSRPKQADSRLAPKEMRFRELFPRGPVRVVLYIDDLDRCPPDKVVQVLEAAQLLLKTSLFVVVLALDVRYITRALEKEYEDILVRRGDPSGLDYIEKIIQVPYRVRQLQKQAVPNYLLAQMDVAVEPKQDATTEPGGTDGPGQRPESDPTLRPSEALRPLDHSPGEDEAAVEQAMSAEVIKFSEAEYAAVRRCLERVQLTPRSAKRLINVLKLIKIFWADRREKIDRPVIQTVSLLLTLSGRYPDLMRDLFPILEQSIIEDTEQEDEESQTFLEFFQAYGDNQMKPEQIQEAFWRQEWSQLHNAVKGLLKDSNVSLRDLGLDTFNLIRSFCFVGDIGYEPGDPAARLDRLSQQENGDDANKSQSEPGPNSGPTASDPANTAE